MFISKYGTLCAVVLCVFSSRAGEYGCNITPFRNTLNQKDLEDIKNLGMSIEDSHEKRTTYTICNNFEDLFNIQEFTNGTYEVRLKAEQTKKITNLLQEASPAVQFIFTQTYESALYVLINTQYTDKPTTTIPQSFHIFSASHAPQSFAFAQSLYKNITLQKNPSVLVVSSMLSLTVMAIYTMLAFSTNQSFKDASRVIMLGGLIFFIVPFGCSALYYK